MLSLFFSEHAWTHADLLGLVLPCKQKIHCFSRFIRCDRGQMPPFFVLSIYDSCSELKVYGTENPRIFPGPLGLA
jgi:hypothetical protein